MTCPGCGAENREGRRFCSKCGAALSRACSGCGFINDPGDEFCGGCGQRVNVATAEPAQHKDAPRDAERRQLTVMFAILSARLRSLAASIPKSYVSMCAPTRASAPR